MRWQLMAVAMLVGLGSERALGQYMAQPMYAPQYPTVWQPVRSRWVDRNCVPTRIVYMAPRPILPPVYPMPMPFINPLAQAMPPFQMAMPQVPAMAAAPLPVQPMQANAAPAPTVPQAAAPVRRAPITTQPREQTVSKHTAEATAEEEAARKLKLARYLEQDGLLAKARQRYEEIVRLFPNTPAAGEARQLLNQGG